MTSPSNSYSIGPDGASRGVFCHLLQNQVGAHLDAPSGPIKYESLGEVKDQWRNNRLPTFLRHWSRGGAAARVRPLLGV